MPRAEHSACGVGFVASLTGEHAHRNLQLALRALRAMEHRGACAADGESGDGAGLMTDIPFALLGHRPTTVAVATLFLSRDEGRRARALQAFEDTFSFLEMPILEYRQVPTNDEVLGPMARERAPRIVHAIIQRPSQSRTDTSFNARLYQAKQLTRSKLKQAGAWKDLFFTSLSTTTIVYKALCRASVLDQFYPDLANPRFKTRFSLLHRRFSTNTRSTWDKAQPFRVLAHNGEINTIAGNRSASIAREAALGLSRDELLTRDEISDSGSLNEMVEALKYRSSIPRIDDILAIMIPPAEEDQPFYRFWGRAMEPWDGPALIAYSNGSTVGARLDRNGFRPARWVMTDELFCLASEAGVFGLDPSEVRSKGTLHAGTGATVRLSRGKVHFRDPSRSREHRGATFDPRLIPLDQVPDHLDASVRERLPRDVTPRALHSQALFGLTVEEIDRVLVPMIERGKEPIGSMGDTARPAIFSTETRSLYDYFVQGFAQVTNPPLDYIRERMVTDLRVFLGSRPNILDPKQLIPPAPGIELSCPVLSLRQMQIVNLLTQRKPSDLRTLAAVIDCTFDGDAGAQGLSAALQRIEEQALARVRDGISVLVLSDREASAQRPAVPSLLALRAVVCSLNRGGKRLGAAVIVQSAEIRTTHQLACAVAFGATAVCPYLGLEFARFGSHKAIDGELPDDREARYIQALCDGLLKIMSKVGISVVRSYHSSKRFSALGIGRKLLARYFDGVQSPLGGLELPDIARHLGRSAARASAQRLDQPLPSSFQLKEKNRGDEGERHAMTAARAKVVHDLVRGRLRGRSPDEVWAKYESLGEQALPVSPRHLLQLREAEQPMPLSEVEPAEAILSRFGAGAMSFGAISAEAQRDLFVAMRRIGGRCNSGEGGENPYYYLDGTSASTKQVASGRFGVTAQYLAAADEIEIKIAQGAKPGEGGQLMGVKVDAAIAKARHASVGVDLISPPPLHDIYSIEDLKQLIYELKQLRPTVPVCVKLVAGANVGTIAVGVMKAGADVIQISGADGGTGAATLSSMKHTGWPWELGLVDVHKALVEHGLRQAVRLRVDGGLATGLDIVLAAALGADEYGFGKLVLIAQGCIMARVCQNNRCPTGIATHDDKFKAKYKGSPEHVETLLRTLAEDVRQLLAGIGVHGLPDVIGQRRFLRARPELCDLIEQRGLDVAGLLEPIPHVPANPRVDAVPRSALNERLIADIVPALDDGRAFSGDYEICSTDRGVLVGISGVLAERSHAQRMRELDGVTPNDKDYYPRPHTLWVRFTGSAGQGFAAFLVPGFDIELRGEANDSVAKSMCGGKVVIRPSSAATFEPCDQVIVGNAALYGATGGVLYVHGRAGDRFAVRNSGAVAVVDGVGLHACEYMTGGTVVILGEVSSNAGAGMTGGVLWMDRSQLPRLNPGWVHAVEGDAEGQTRLRKILAEYHDATGSERVRRILDEPQRMAQLVMVVPRGAAAPTKRVESGGEMRLRKANQK